MRKNLFFCILAAIAVMTASCEMIHEWPADPAVDPTMIKLNLKLHCTGPLTQYANGETYVETENFFESEKNLVACYTIAIFKDEEFDKEMVYCQTLKRSQPAAGEDIDLGTFTFNALHYRVCVWQDLRNDAANLKDKHYITASGLDAIKVQPTGYYVGSTDSKLAQAATCKIDLSMYRGSRNVELEEVVPLIRPQGKFVLVSTDYAKFVDSFIRNVPGAKLEDYTTLLEYQLYIPTGYDVINWNGVWGENLNASATGYWFESGIKRINNNEAVAAFDYILLDSRNTVVRVKLRTYNSKGELVNTSKDVEVPLAPGKVTVVRDEFLTKDTGGGIQINPGFDGDIDVPVE